MILNTVVTYARSVIGAGLAIFGSRWVLSALGPVDFGLFSVVGSIIIFITFLNSVMSGSASRHYAYALGQADADEVNRWFNAALGIHMVLAAVLVLAGWQIGQYVIVHYLTIPSERLAASLWVFRVSLISAFTSMISVPFIAMFTAKQHIAQLAIWNLLYSVLVFSLAWCLRYVSGDRLLFYAVGMVCVILLVQVGQISWAMACFKECRVKPKHWFHRSRVKEIVSFAGWNLFGSFGGILRNQGTALLLNIQFGPRVNAAYGIANHVSAQSDQLAAAMLGAFTPEITTSEGRGDRSRMLSLAQRASKFGTILVMLFAIPLMMEMDYVLALWLKEPPQYSAVFCRMILATFLIDRLSIGYMVAVQAYGKIAGYQATLGSCLILTLPLVWLFFQFGAPPVAFGVAFITTMLCVSAGRVLWVRKLFGVPVRQWISGVLLPCVFVGSASALTALALCWFLPPSFVRCCLVLFASCLATLGMAWGLALGSGEREFLKQTINKIRLKMRRSRGSQQYSEAVQQGLGNGS